MLKKTDLLSQLNLGRRRFFHSLGLAGALVLGQKIVPGGAGAAPMERPRTGGGPPRPWAEAASQKLPPGRPGRDYTPVAVPNGSSLPFKTRRGVKIFHLVAEPIVQEVAPGLTVRTWGYNGRTPGPVIEAVRGDRVRIYVTNRLPADHTVHWHAMLLPSGMDGVSGLNQPPIRPGETYRYEYYLPRAGTFMYHSHHDSMTQDGLGLVGMMVVHPRLSRERRPERDFALMLHEWRLDVGTDRPNPNEMTDFNVLTINGKAFPGTEPLVARLGDRVRIRFGNLSAMDHHPIHLHGYSFKIVETDGGPIPEAAQWPETTVLVPVGSTRSVEFLADNPGDWIMHCHMTHHMMNQMGHGLPNMVGADFSGLEEKIRGFIPGYMAMGSKGMGDMAGMKMDVPQNSIAMLGGQGPYSSIDMGGMTTILKVREKLDSYADPGWYEPPEGTMTRQATKAEMEADGIEPGGG